MSGVGSSSTPASAATAGPIAFGAYAKPRNGQSERQAVEAFEAQAGRKLEVVRVFETWNQAFPDSYHTWLKSSGHSIILSVKATRTNGTRVTWSSIANAQPGSQVYNEMVTWAQRVKNYGVPIYVTLSHEPEAGSSTSNGTATDFIAAWRRWVDLFRAEGVTNAKYMWIMTDYSFFVSTSDRRWAPKWYPGDAWVDSMGTDAYNWYTCRPGTANSWKSLQQIIEPFRAFGAQHPDKDLWLTEFASVEDPARSGRKATWFDDARELFKKPGWEQFEGIVYFNATYSQSGRTVCYWYTDTTTSSLSSYRAMALDPFYAGPAFAGGTTPTTTTTTTSTTTTSTSLPDSSTTTSTSTTSTTTTSTTTTTTGPPPAGEEVLFVVGNAASATPGDVAVRTRLVDLGYTVHLLDDSAASPTVAEDMVVISSSASSSLVAGKYRDTPVPVLVYKPWVYQPMGLASTFGTASGTSASITNPASPLAAGLTGTVNLTTSRGPIGWGTPAASAEVVATASNRAVLYAYDTGDTLTDGSTAASCRVVLPFNDQTFATATAQGRALLDAAVGWAANC
ncbi:MAG: glycosyl hydrolase [Ilumatobacteraceae bacterium]